MYSYPFCGSVLEVVGGYDRSGAGYGGPSLDVTQYSCHGCHRDFLHTVKETFGSGFIGLEVKEWKTLPQQDWPQFSNPAGRMP